MRIGSNDFNYLEIQEYDGETKITIWNFDYTTYVDIRLSQSEKNTLIQCLTGARCPNCEEIVDDYPGMSISKEHTCSKEKK